MRSGGCAVRQALAADAAAVMAQAVSAARRRGHAQVTPLHVASALLAGEGGGVLRAACLRSRPGGAARPLQCKALEMCLNVALNRLATAPVAGGAALFGFHHRAPPLPALSNALAAAFKRAQASQRRGGSSEQQGAAAGSSSNKKVALEQLVISILDDPSVNRVLREAGFCSADVKDHVIAVEQPAAGAVSSSPEHHSSSNTATTTTTTGGVSPSPNPNPNPAGSNDAEPFPVTIKATTTNKPDEMAGGGRAAAWRAAGLHPGAVGPHGGGLALNLSADSSELITYGGTGMMAAPTPARSVPTWFRRCHGPVPVLPGCDLALSFSPPPPAADSSFVYGAFLHHYNNLLDPRQHLWPINHRHDVINGPVMADETHDHQQHWPASPNNPGSSTSVSVSSAGSGARPRRFAELTAENLKVLCGALEARVPRHHRDVAPGVASAVLRRRSGVTPRTAARPASSAATWLVFRGPDAGAKAAVARELARLVFGSYDDLTVLGSTAGEPARSGSCSGAGLGRKRRRSSSSPVRYVMQSLHDAVRENPHRVFLIDGSDSDYYSEEEEEAGILMNAIATGTVRACNNDGDVASLEDAIVVLSCEGSSHSPWWSRAASPRRLKKARGGVRDGDVAAGKEDDEDGAENGAKRPRFSLDLNACAVDGDGLVVEDEGVSSSLHGRAELFDAVDGVFLFQC